MTKSLRLQVVFWMIVPLAAVEGLADGPAEADYPLYKEWARHEIGSSASYTAQWFDASGAKVITSVVSVLKSVSPNSVTIETTIGGHSRSQVITAKVDAGTIDPSTSEEEIDVMGKMVKCRKYLLTSATDGQNHSNTTITIWVSDQVVGGLVKLTTPDVAGKHAIMRIISSVDNASTTRPT